MVIAYLKVSTEKQLLISQKGEVLRFVEKNGLSIDKQCTETISGSVSTKDRKLSELLKRMHPGDTLIVTEISKLSRTLFEIMAILSFYIKKQVVLCSTKEGHVFQSDVNSRVLGSAFGLMAEIERSLTSMCIKRALACRKQEGMILGRRKGDTPKIKLLSINKRVLTRELDKGTTYSKLAEKVGVSRTTLFRFVKATYQ